HQSQNRIASHHIGLKLTTAVIKAFLWRGLHHSRPVWFDEFNWDTKSLGVDFHCKHIYGRYVAAYMKTDSVGDALLKGKHHGVDLGSRQWILPSKHHCTRVRLGEPFSKEPFLLGRHNSRKLQQLIETNESP
nr:hypothetical protein [Tanacetum cinerariifolium]